MEDGPEHPTIDDGPRSPFDDNIDADLIGVDVGGYVIDGQLGRGGMGVVFSATHPVIGKRAAIKVLKPSLSNNPATVERFVQEARSVNQIGHPNIVDIFGFGSLPDGRSYLIMDLLEGESLRKRVKRGPLAIAEAIHVIDEVASALAAAHDKGFIHRDLKPDNVFLVSHGSHGSHGSDDLRGRVDCKLLDFGLAKLMPNATTPARAFRTATGAQLGTPDYMSPEQIFGAGGVDARTDVYALGVMAFEILVGTRPRRYSDGTFELDGKTVAEAVIAKANPPRELAQLVEAMLAHDPDNRPSLAAVRAVLKRVRSAVPSSSVVGLEVSLPPGRPGVATPPTGEPTVDESPRSRRASSQPRVTPRPSQPPIARRPSQPGLASSNAGLASPAFSGAKTTLGVAPPGARPQKPHPIAAKSAVEERGAEGRLWLVLAIVLVVISSTALVVVLVR